MLDNYCWGMDRVKHLEMSSYTIDFTIVEGTMSQRQRFAGGLGLGVRSHETWSVRDSPSLLFTSSTRQ